MDQGASEPQIVELIWHLQFSSSIKSLHTLAGTANPQLAEFMQSRGRFSRLDIVYVDFAGPQTTLPVFDYNVRQADAPLLSLQSVADGHWVYCSDGALKHGGPSPDAGNTLFSWRVQTVAG